MKKLKPHQRTLLFAITLSVVLWFLPYVRLVLLPLFYLDTHLHELCHAIAGFATGAPVGRIIMVYAAGNGDTALPLDHPIIVGSAGYLGAILIGGLVVAFSKTELASRLILRSLSIVLLLSLTFLVKGDMIGIASGGFWVLAHWGLSTLKGGNVIAASQFVGIQQCVNALQAVWYIVQAGSSIQSDAKIVGDATSTTALMWALVWALISFIVGLFSLKIAWSGTKSTTSHSTIPRA